MSKFRKVTKYKINTKINFSGYMLATNNWKLKIKTLFTVTLKNMKLLENSVYICDHGFLYISIAEVAKNRKLKNRLHQN